eukprot:scaffold8900_cov119-Isochrysis_galbana.AAC.5
MIPQPRRHLVHAVWNAMRRTMHARDTVLIAPLFRCCRRSRLRSLLEREAALCHLLLVCLKVVLVEVVYPDVTVLSPACICAAMRRKRQRIDGAEVPRHAAKLLAKGVVEEDGLELALLSRGCGDGHGVLPAAGDQVWAMRQG